MAKVRNEYITGTAHVDSMKNKVRETRLRWYGHILKRKNSYVGKRMIAISVPNKRKRGRPKRKFMDGIKEDMKVVEVNEEDAINREKWMGTICCGD